MPIKIKRRNAVQNATKRCRKAAPTQVAVPPASTPYFDLQDVLALNVATTPDLQVGALHIGELVPASALPHLGITKPNHQIEQWTFVTVVLTADDLVIVHDRAPADGYGNKLRRLVAQWVRSTLDIACDERTFEVIAFDTTAERPASKAGVTASATVFRSELATAADSLRNAMVAHRASCPLPLDGAELCARVRAHLFSLPDIPYALPEWARAR